MHYSRNGTLQSAFIIAYLQQKLYFCYQMNTKLQLVESNFDPQVAPQCDLLIQVGAESISYAVIEKGSDQLKALVEIEGSLKDLELLYTTNALLGYQYRKTKISVDTTKFTFIPREVFSDFYIENYAKFIQPRSASDLLINDIRGFKIKNLIAVETETQNILKSHFPAAAIFSQATPFIEGSWKISKDTVKNQLFVNIRQDSFEAVLIKDGQLHFYNIFECELPDEFNYFLLLIIKQFNLQTSDTMVVASGSIELKDPFYFRISKYFDNISIADVSLLIRYYETFELISLQKHFSLLSLNLCE